MARFSGDQCRPVHGLPGFQYCHYRPADDFRPAAREPLSRHLDYHRLLADDDDIAGDALTAGGFIRPGPAF